MHEQARVAGPGELLAFLLRREAREHGGLGRTRLVEGDDDALAGADQCAGALDHLAEHGGEVKGGVVGLRQGSSRSVWSPIELRRALRRRELTVQF